jgi:hypothetical protein
MPFPDDKKVSPASAQTMKVIIKSISMAIVTVKDAENSIRFFKKDFTFIDSASF